jgi:hypothetical protein
VTLEISIVAFFFPMGSCEHVTTPNPGQTKKIDVGNIIFHDKQKHILPAACSIHNAKYVTLTFVDQKNGEKIDVQTQQQTGNAMLCPVKQARHTLVSRIRRSIPNYHDTITVSILSTYLLQQLRFTCRSCSGKNTFGFNPNGIGTHSSVMAAPWPFS